MQVVGELINASRKVIRPMIEEQNATEIAKVAQAQHDAGAAFIDVNAGVFVDKEAEYLTWLVKTVQETVDTPCCIDSPSPEAIEAAMAVHKGTPMLNSISLEKERYEKLMPVLKNSPDAKVVALCMSDDGMPESKEDRVKIASKLINDLVGAGMKIENIYVDPLVQPVSTNDRYGMEFLNAIETIRTEFEGVHGICGLSNISFGLPERKMINQVFVVMAIAKGLDAAIINPLDQRMMANIITAQALAGQDEYCTEYLTAFRQKRFEF